MDDIYLKLIANPHRVRHHFVNMTKKDELRLIMEYYFNESLSSELFDVILEYAYHKINEEVVSQVMNEMIHTITCDNISCTYISNKDIS